MSGAERSALVVTTTAAAQHLTTGAVLRADEVTALLRASGYAVHRIVPASLTDENGPYDLGVAVSYACAPAVRPLAALARRTWLDAVDSWLLVDGSGLRSGRVLYAARAAREAYRLARMPAPDLVTWISGADLAHDRGTVRGRHRLVLPGSVGSPPELLPAGPRTRVVLAGDWDYPPNAAGLRWFVRRVLPALEALVPGAAGRVHVFGAGRTAVARAAGCTVVGYVADGGALYRLGDVHAAPVHFGGGVKRKVLQPLLAGLPVVTTPAGAHGLRDHPMLTVTRGPAEFAEAVAAALLSPRATMAGLPAFDRDDTAAVATWLRASPPHPISPA